MSVLSTNLYFSDEYTAPEDVFHEHEPFVLVSRDGQEQESTDDIYDDTENPDPMDTTVSSSDPDQTRTEHDDNGNHINDDNRSINWDEPYGRYCYR